MARYKANDLKQTKMIALSYADQLVEGSFEHALNELVERHSALQRFDIAAVLPLSIVPYLSDIATVLAGR